MKALRTRILTVLLCLLLSACGGAERGMPAAVAPAAEPVPTPLPTSPPPVFSSYTIPLGAAVPIYSGPDAAYGYVQNVGQDGVYTIVEEAVGADGSLWGRLKSGVGWVQLGGATEEDGPPFTADYASPELLQSGDFARCIVDNGEYCVQLMILPHETLRDVSLEMLCYGGDGYTVDCVYDTFPELGAAWPLVADVVFYGDMTTYGLSFTDESGAQRHFAVSMSGKDGSLLAVEY